MREKKYAIPAIAAAVALAAARLFLIRPVHFQRGFHADPKLQSSLDGIMQDFRKIIVLIDGAESLDEAARTRSIASPSS